MWGRDEDHAGHKRQRFDEHRAGQQIASLGIELRLIERDLRKVVPEASAAIDDRHLREETSLAVADDDHLVKDGILATGIDVLTHGYERFAQTHRRQRDGIAAIVDEEP